MDRICRHARKIQEKWTAPVDAMPIDDAPPHIVDEDERIKYAGWTQHVDIDDADPNNWQCGWMPVDGPLPPPIARSSGGNSLRHGDCDACRRFAPVEIAIPGTKGR